MGFIYALRRAHVSKREYAHGGFRAVGSNMIQNYEFRRDSERCSIAIPAKEVLD